MLSLYTYLMARLEREEGQGMAEYGLIIALVAVVVIGALTLIGTNLSSIFGTIATAVGS
jgi:pilus assembly protein Flp/PilA